MTEKRIFSPETADETVRALYQSAFPEEEQIPWDDLLRLVATMPLDFTT